AFAAAAGLSGPAALSRLHLPSGAAMASGRHRHRAGSTLLVGTRLKQFDRRGRWGLIMSRLFAGLVAIALLWAAHPAVAAPATPGSIDPVPAAPATPPAAAAPSTAPAATTPASETATTPDKPEAKK